MPVKNENFLRMWNHCRRCLDHAAMEVLTEWIKMTRLSILVLAVHTAQILHHFSFPAPRRWSPTVEFMFSVGPSIDHLLVHQLSAPSAPSPRFVLPMFTVCSDLEAHLFRPYAPPLVHHHVRSLSCPWCLIPLLFCP